MGNCSNCCRSNNEVSHKIPQENPQAFFCPFTHTCAGVICAMFDTIRAWLNGNREYFTGTSIFKKCSKDVRLIALLSSGKNAYNEKRLQQEMLQVYTDLKAQQVPDTIIINIPKKPEKYSAKSQKNIPAPESEIYTGAKNHASKVYKDCMNKRAQLFAMAKVEDWEEENTLARIAERGKLAIEVVMLYNQASKLYDAADFILENGRTPAEVLTDAEEEPFKHLPDHLIKHTLSNARKALNKLKVKEPTPERLALIAQHTASIQILEKKWHSLNSVAAPQL